MRTEIKLNCGCIVCLDVHITRDDAFIPIADLSNGKIIKTCGVHT